MENKTACFEVSFDRPDIKKKTVWAAEWRSTPDDMWVEFLTEDGQVASSVRTVHLLAIDRACTVPNTDDAGRGSRLPSAPASLQPVPSPAGPVEAAARAAARPGAPEAQQPPATAGGGR